MIVSTRIFQKEAVVKYSCAMYYEQMGMHGLDFCTSSGKLFQSFAAYGLYNYGML